jgi:hypothetical protein
MVNKGAYEIGFDTPNLAIGYTKEGDRSRSHNNLYLHVVKGGPAGGGFYGISSTLRM